MPKRKKPKTKTKTCGKCGKRKSVAEFAKKRQARDGLQEWCKACAKVYTHARRMAALEDDPVTEWVRKLFFAARHRAKSKGSDCTITQQDIVDQYEEQDGLCAVTGIQMSMGYGGGRCSTHMSLDRIDNAKGYIPGNIRLVCDRVNIMRGTMSDYELIDWCQKIVDNSTADIDTISETYEPIPPIEPIGDIDIHSDD